MIFELMLILIVMATFWAGVAMVWKKAPLAAGLISMAHWVVLGYGASSIDFVQDNGQLEEGVGAEPALIVLSFGMALLSLLVVVAAATGSYATDEEHGHDRPFDKEEMFP